MIGLIFLKRVENISKIIKGFQKQINRFFKNNNLNNLSLEQNLENYFKYLKIAGINTDNFEVLDEQKDIFNKIVSVEKFLLISFTISVFENICEWIIDEDE